LWYNLSLILSFS